MKIEINIEEQLEKILRKIGLGDNEIENEYSIISQKIHDLFISILCDFTKISDNLENKVEDLESKLFHYNHLVGGSDDSIQIDLNKSLKIRYEQANQQLYELKNIFATRSRNYNSLYDILVNLFEKLEIPMKDRGNFKEKGTDISVERIEEAGKLAFELKEAVDIKQKKMDTVIKELNELHKKLRLDPIEVPHTLGSATISKYEKELNYLQDLYQSSIDEKKKTINKIHQIEDFFSIQSPNFVIESEKSENISFCDEKELGNLLKYLENLQKRRSEAIPEFIEQDKQILYDLYKELHMEIPSKNELPSLYYKANSISPKKRNDSISIAQSNFDIFDELENEIERLNQFKEETKEIRNYLLKRDRILNMSKKKPKKYLSFNQVVANERMITVDLPIINIQLEPLLEEYEKRNLSPFLWEGKDVLKQIKIQNANYREKTGLVHSRFVSSITNK